MVTIPAGNQIVKDEAYCRQAAMRDPGGSAYCPSVTPVAFERVHQVTYSYMSGPIASDEYSNTRHAFNVYFRPEELGSAERTVLLRKGGRADAGGSFELTILKEFEMRQVVDQTNSTVWQGT